MMRIDEGFWGFGVLGFWGFGVLGFWGVGVLGFWGFWVLGFWGFGISTWVALWPGQRETRKRHFGTANMGDIPGYQGLTKLAEHPSKQTKLWRILLGC